MSTVFLQVYCFKQILKFAVFKNLRAHSFFYKFTSWIFLQAYILTSLQVENIKLV